MLEWLGKHSTELNVLISALTAMVWLIYLQLLLSSMLRQRRSNLLINRSAGIDDEARCVISNMGAEPIYVTSIIADIEMDGQTYSSVVTDREEISVEESSDRINKSNQGPLDSGQSRDLGSFRELVNRVLNYHHLENRLEKLTDLTLTVVAASGHSSRVAAGQQRFQVFDSDEGKEVYLPSTLMTKQLRSVFKRKAVKRRLNNVLKAEGDALRAGKSARSAREE